MSILIKGMKMPTEGIVTVNIHSDGLVYVQGAYPTELYEAVYIPTPHGRLIDETQIPYIDLNADMPQSKVRVWTTFKDKLDRLPTIIEAEEGTDHE